MADLTVVILTKDEELNLRKCVTSFHGAAKRFVIVDSRSTDGTKALCEQLNVELQKVGSRLDFYENDWVNHATQFNWGLDETRIETEWTMRMDSDEELTPELLQYIQTELDHVSSDVSGIVIRRRLIFMGRWIRHGGRYPEYLLRIFRTGKARCESRIMDEHLIIHEGQIVNVKADIIDRNQKSLEWWINKHNWYSGREVQDHQRTLAGLGAELESDKVQSSKQAEVKRKVKDGGYYRLPLFFRAHLYFIYRYYFRLGFLDGKEGKIFNFLQAYWYRFLVDAKMYEVNEHKGSF
ncbi:glycosyltransferase family 2 protein [Lacticaseibacillus parakribbianus]|uniref:glycosyltransferase family 2 protein n=1 Tax=Lacticaseibacillus parakribbianus TaxID=2970927 RepID=UPI0021CB8FED|nr:glycosyltransferase family 2 protein [Lacticaseibacillus parakribbianus]